MRKLTLAPTAPMACAAMSFAVMSFAAMSLTSLPAHAIEVAPPQIAVPPPRVVYAQPPQRAQAPTRVAYGSNRSMGGGFIEFLFSDGQSGTPPQAYEPQYAPDPRGHALLPGEREMIEPQQQTMAPAQPAMDARYEKQMVSYQGKEGPGTVIVDTPNKFLYLVQGNGQALRYGIGVGRPGFTWSGVKTITAKKEWPAWTPPPEMLKRRPDLPRHMEGGPENPLGARAMYLGSTLYRIHGSNEPWTIGTNVSSGCIRMRNEDVMDLYGRVKVGTKVVVM